MYPEDTDPSNNGTPPDRAMIELALRVAQHLVATGDTTPSGPDYWRGAIEALRWSLDERTTTPVSDRPAAADLTMPRDDVHNEADYAYGVMAGKIQRTINYRYLVGAENTLCWIYSGRGFANLLDPDWVRQEYGITTA